MPSIYADWKRDGLNIVIKTAKAICQLNQKFGYIIKDKFADNPAIIALMVIIDNLCAALPDALIEYDALSFDDPAIPSDPSGLAGINPSAPEPPPIDTGV